MSNIGKTRTRRTAGVNTVKPVTQNSNEIKREIAQETAKLIQLDSMNFRGIDEVREKHETKLRELKAKL
jgi:hypothetical protein